MLETVTGWNWLNPSPQGNDINALWLEKRGRWPMRELWAVGNCGTVLRWNDLRFDTIPFGDVVNLRAIWGAAGDDLWLAGDGGTVFHFDGQTFSKHALPHPAVAVINSIFGFGTNDVWAVGAVRDAGDALAFHWDGQRWTEIPVEGATLEAVWGPRPDDVWAVGYRGTVLHFDGSAWTRCPMASDRDFHAVAGLEGQTWIVGQGGALLLNEGQGFRPIESGTRADLKAVAVMTPRLTVAAGASGTVVLGLDRKFAPVQSLSTEIVCMAPLPGHIVWMGGRGGVLVSEMVGMSDFAAQSLRCRLSTIWGIDEDDVWVAGRNVVARYQGGSWSNAIIGQASPSTPFGAPRPTMCGPPPTTRSSCTGTAAHGRPTSFHSTNT
jgi:hypothetical protein